jgi:hypothetical protein
MNRKRTEFLERNNQEPHIKSYIFGQGHHCDIPDGALIEEFVYYPYTATINKGKLINGAMLLPYSNGQWSEDKIWLVSLKDARFFVDWYNQNHQANAVLIELSKISN